MTPLTLSLQDLIILMILCVVHLFYAPLLATVCFQQVTLMRNEFIGFVLCAVLLTLRSSSAAFLPVLCNTTATTQTVMASSNDTTALSGCVNARLSLTVVLERNATFALTGSTVSSLTCVPATSDVTFTSVVITASTVRSVAQATAIKIEGAVLRSVSLVVRNSVISGRVVLQPNTTSALLPLISVSSVAGSVADARVVVDASVLAVEYDVNATASRVQAAGRGAILSLRSAVGSAVTGAIVNVTNSNATVLVNDSSVSWDPLSANVSVSVLDAGSLDSAWRRCSVAMERSRLSLQRTSDLQTSTNASSVFALSTFWLPNCTNVSIVVSSGSLGTAETFLSTHYVANCSVHVVGASSLTLQRSPVHFGAVSNATVCPSPTSCGARAEGLTFEVARSVVRWRRSTQFFGAWVDGTVSVKGISALPPLLNCTVEFRCSRVFVDAVATEANISAFLAIPPNSASVRILVVNSRVTFVTDINRTVACRSGVADAVFGLIDLRGVSGNATPIEITFVGVEVVAPACFDARTLLVDREANDSVHANSSSSAVVNAGCLSVVSTPLPTSTPFATMIGSLQSLVGTGEWNTSTRITAFFSFSREECFIEGGCYPSLSQSASRSASTEESFSASVTASFSAAYTTSVSASVSGTLTPSSTMTPSPTTSRTSTATRTESVFTKVVALIFSNETFEAYDLLTSPLRASLLLLGTHFNPFLANSSWCSNVVFASPDNLAQNPLSNRSAMGVARSTGLGWNDSTYISPVAARIGEYMAANGSLIPRTALTADFIVPSDGNIFRGVTQDTEFWFRLDPLCTARADVQLYFSVLIKRLPFYDVSLPETEALLQNLALPLALLGGLPFFSWEAARITQPLSVLRCGVDEYPTHYQGVGGWSVALGAATAGSVNAQRVGVIITNGVIWLSLLLLQLAAAATYSVATETTFLKGRIHTRFPSLQILPLSALLQPTVMAAAQLLYSTPVLDAAWWVGAASAFVCAGVLVSVAAQLIWNRASFVFDADCGWERGSSLLLSSWEGTGGWKDVHEERVLCMTQRHWLWIGEYKGGCSRWTSLAELVVSVALGVFSGLPRGESHCVPLMWASGVTFLLRTLYYVVLRPFRAHMLNVFTIVLSALESLLCASLLAYDWLDVLDLSQRSLTNDISHGTARALVYVLITVTSLCVLRSVWLLLKGSAASSADPPSQPTFGTNERMHRLVDSVVDELDLRLTEYDPALHKQFVTAHLELLLPGCEFQAEEMLLAVLHELDVMALERNDKSLFTQSMEELYELLTERQLGRPQRTEANDNFFEETTWSPRGSGPNTSPRDVELLAVPLRQECGRDASGLRLWSDGAHSPVTGDRRSRRQFLDDILQDDPQESIAL